MSGKDHQLASKTYYMAHRKDRILYAKKYREDNKAKIRENNKKRYAAHKEERQLYARTYYIAHKEEKLAYNKNQYAVRKEELLLRCKKWRGNNKATIQQYKTEHKEALAEYSKEYYQNNRQIWKKHQASSIYKEYQRVYQSQRRRELKNRGSFTAGDIKDLYTSQGGNCYYCRISIETGYHIEHMVPLCRDGRNDISNICLACVSCNLQKHTKTAEEFMNEYHINEGDNYV